MSTVEIWYQVDKRESEHEPWVMWAQRKSLSDLTRAVEVLNLMGYDTRMYSYTVTTTVGDKEFYGYSEGLRASKKYRPHR
jgi:hypothetical protein